MKRTFAAIVILAAISACTATKLQVSYTQQDWQPKKYNKLAVLALASSDPNRLVLEEAVAEKFTSSGVTAISTFNIFPLAARTDVLADMTFTEEEMEEHIKNTVKKFNIDALMIISVVNTKTTERYVSETVGYGGYYNPAWPVYNYSYYNYYSYVYNTTHTTGYYTTETTYQVETNLYDVESEKLIWTGITKTAGMTSIESEAPKFAKIVVWDVLGKKVVLADK